MVYEAETFDLDNVDIEIHLQVMGLSTDKVPDYSSNMEDAMKVHRQMVDLGHCCFQLDADHCCTYRASYTHRSSKGKKHLPTSVVEVTDNPALAICLAALVFRGVDLARLRTLPAKKIPHIKAKKKTTR